MENAILVDNLSKSYGSIRALGGVNLGVQRGTVLALLGPNGAGKTTLIRILTTLLSPDSGTATIEGLDVKKDASNLRAIIGLAGQFAAVDENLTGRENLELVGWLYHLSPKARTDKARDLLSQFDLLEVGERLVKTYSGGMRRRLDLAASLVGDPKILFLDEPTAGLDPRARIALWDIIRDLAKRGTTILLTTQYLDEADQLADRIAVIDHGKIIAIGTSRDLKERVGQQVVEIRVDQNQDLQKVADLLTKQSSKGRPTIDSEKRSIIIPVRDGARNLINMVRILDQTKISIVDIFLRRPTLDEVFLALTGLPPGRQDEGVE